MVDKRIPQLAHKLVKAAGIRDPFVIAEDLHITVLFRDDFIRQKGAFKVIAQNSFIFINGHLSEEMQRLVCAHELGHALLHRQLGMSAIGLMEFEIFDIKDQLEYDANAFAAALLLDDGELLDILQDGYDIVHVASMLKTNVNLVLLKLNEMNKHGYNFQLPCSPDRRFLGNIADDADKI